jgi:hypothetical protein
MCTLTWNRRGDGGYDLRFNRDELDTRAEEGAPMEAVRDGVGVLAPRDGDAGGTWLLANAYGLTVALLNDYASPQSRGRARATRGELPWLAASARSAEEALRALPRERLGDYRPFHLVAVGPADDRSLHWTGVTLREGGAPPFLTSSSHQPARVMAARAARYLAAEGDAEAVARLHAEHDPADGAASVCMRRPDAGTRSRIRVQVSPAEVILLYERLRWPGPATTERVEQRLTRRSR